MSEIRESSWIRRLERMNAVHPYHKPEHFVDYRHFVFAFHDRTLKVLELERRLLAPVAPLCARPP